MPVLNIQCSIYGETEFIFFVKNNASPLTKLPVSYICLKLSTKTSQVTERKNFLSLFNPEIHNHITNNTTVAIIIDQ